MGKLGVSCADEQQGGFSPLGSPAEPVPSVVGRWKPSSELLAGSLRTYAGTL
jgi:hypothetical protein